MKFTRVCLSLVVLIAACGEKEAKMGKAVVSFANGTSAALRVSDYPSGSSGIVTEHGTRYLSWPASSFGTKLVQIYLSEDVGANGWDNSGTLSYIWINPACGTKTEDDGSVKMANNGACDTSKISEFFELARPSAQVNADLNAQEIPVAVGTYRYVRVQVCDNQIPDSNIRFASTAGGVVSPVTKRTGNCVMTPSKIDPPITIGEDESVVISLNYDLSTALLDWYYDVDTKTQKSTGPLPERCAISETTGSTLCARDFAFTATAAKK